ncbi:hypothetical protein C6341_g22469 [Phytophthora cactorum]|nr:hypothetical protein C6341_g22469 [Phytophthora cactorum]
MTVKLLSRALVQKYLLLVLALKLRVLPLHVCKALVERPTDRTMNAVFITVISQLMWSELIYVVEMELAKVPAKLVNAWGVAEQQSTVATTLVVVDTLLWLVSLGKVAETTAKAVAVTVTSPLVWKFLFLVVMTLVRRPMLS